MRSIFDLQDFYFITLFRQGNRHRWATKATRNTAQSKVSNTVRKGMRTGSHRILYIDTVNRFLCSGV